MRVAFLIYTRKIYSTLFHRIMCLPLPAGAFAFYWQWFNFLYVSHIIVRFTFRDYVIDLLAKESLCVKPVSLSIRTSS
ncbi:hypothetical protein AXL64_10445 [Salmonella enterica subsp. enterica]|uniref:Uncharacterized protein n=1 Tax=Salmonella enterica subsp. salamae TaxID=59202 RepID=A0A702L172_SALER|nr:hypothetical protein [Salmonella enterica]EAW1758808.1 hypothetical protein [Salmonella enterica subsp. enterica]ECF5954870.1 hypothetical protein [Salmonella enterica subsp. salamae]EAW2503584.1 hypothetical protein [Salmonella enterica subsp. enterica]EAZ4759903.1 hypothetical protein [Salmonella enterica]